MNPHRPSPQPHTLRELQRILEAPLRRPWLAILPLTITLAAAIALSFLLPPRYKSQTVILVEPDPIPASLVPKLSNDDVGRRLQTLRQEVQSRTRLELAARELDPYGTVAKQPLINTIERMRAAVSVSVKGNDAFSIEFEHRDPRMAMLVADRLTTLFMEEVAGGRERQVSEAYQFIESQMESAREQLEQKEEALREFKERHMGQLPEQVQANLATLQRLQLEQQTVVDSLRKATDAQLLLESGGPAAATPVAGGSPPPDSLAVLRAQLTQLRSRYTDQHPDVKALVSRIVALEASSSAAYAGDEADAPPADPVAAAAHRRLQQARQEVRVLRERLTDVDRRIGAFQARVEAAPRREQEIVSLTRDYQKLSENYTQLLAKKLDAEMAARLEQRSKGQQFRMIDPAYLPVHPSFPNRGLFALAGALAGLLLGVGLAVTVDYLDPTLKEADEAATALRLPVLAVVPYIRPREQERLAGLPEGASAPVRDPDQTLPRRKAIPFGRGTERGAGRR